MIYMEWHLRAQPEPRAGLGSLPIDVRLRPESKPGALLFRFDCQPEQRVEMYTRVTVDDITPVTATEKIEPWTAGEGDSISRTWWYVDRRSFDPSLMESSGGAMESRLGEIRFHVYGAYGRPTIGYEKFLVRFSENEWCLVYGGAHIPMEWWATEPFHRNRPTAWERLASDSEVV